jgi:hypothetical protein
MPRHRLSTRPSKGRELTKGLPPETVGLFDTDQGLRLGVSGEPFWRTHITPQGEFRAGLGLAAPTDFARGVRQARALGTDRWDDFDRADSPLSSSNKLPSGHTWVITEEAAGSDPGPLLAIKDRALVYGQAGKSYMWTRPGGSVAVGGLGPAPSPAKVGCRFRFGPGSTNNATIGLIVSPLTGPNSNGATGVATNSVHASFGPTSWSVGFFRNGTALDIFASAGLDGAYTIPVGEVRSAALERVAHNRLRIHLPDGRVIDVTDANVLTRTGLALKLDDWWGATALIEHFQPSATFATDRLPAFVGYSATGDSAGIVAATTPPEAWHEIGATGEPAFENGWSNYAGGYATAAYRKVGNVVYIKGLVKGGTIGNVAVFSFPAGYQPALSRMFVAANAAGTAGRLDVLSNGQVRILAGSTTFTSIECVLPL